MVFFEVSVESFAPPSLPDLRANARAQIEEVAVRGQQLTETALTQLNHLRREIEPFAVFQAHGDNFTTDCVGALPNHLRPIADTLVTQAERFKMDVDLQLKAFGLSQLGLQDRRLENCIEIATQIALATRELDTYMAGLSVFGIGTDADFESGRRVIADVTAAIDTFLQNQSTEALEQLHTTWLTFSGPIVTELSGLQGTLSDARSVIPDARREMIVRDHIGMLELSSRQEAAAMTEAQTEFITSFAGQIYHLITLTADGDELHRKIQLHGLLQEHQLSTVMEEAERWLLRTELSAELLAAARELHTYIDRVGRAMDLFSAATPVDSDQHTYLMAMDDDAIVAAYDYHREHNIHNLLVSAAAEAYPDALQSGDEILRVMANLIELEAAKLPRPCADVLVYNNPELASQDIELTREYVELLSQYERIPDFHLTAIVYCPGRFSTTEAITERLAEVEQSDNSPEFCADLNYTEAHAVLAAFLDAGQQYSGALDSSLCAHALLHFSAQDEKNGVNAQALTGRLDIDVDVHHVKEQLKLLEARGFVTRPHRNRFAAATSNDTINACRQALGYRHPSHEVEEPADQVDPLVLLDRIASFQDPLREAQGELLKLEGDRKAWIVRRARVRELYGGEAYHLRHLPRSWYELRVWGSLLQFKKSMLNPLARMVTPLHEKRIDRAETLGEVGSIVGYYIANIFRAKPMPLEDRQRVISDAENGLNAPTKQDVKRARHKLSHLLDELRVALNEGLAAGVLGDDSVPVLSTLSTENLTPALSLVTQSGRRRRVA